MKIDPDLSFQDATAFLRSKAGWLKTIHSLRLQAILLCVHSPGGCIVLTHVQKVSLNIVFLYEESVVSQRHLSLLRIPVPVPLT